MQPSNRITFVARSAALCFSLLLVASAYGIANAQVQTSPATSPAVTTITANSSSTCAGQTICNPLKYNSLNDLLAAVLKAAIELGSIILTLALVWVGFKFVAARGNEEKIRSARTALMWTVIGGLILLGATAIQTVITSTVGAITS